MIGPVFKKMREQLPCCWIGIADLAIRVSLEDRIWIQLREAGEMGNTLFRLPVCGDVAIGFEHALDAVVAAQEPLSATMTSWPCLVRWRISPSQKPLARSSGSISDQGLGWMLWSSSWVTCPGLHFPNSHRAVRRRGSSSRCRRRSARRRWHRRRGAGVRPDAARPGTFAHARGYGDSARRPHS